MDTRWPISTTKSLQRQNWSERFVHLRVESRDTTVDQAVRVSTLWTTGTTTNVESVERETKQSLSADTRQGIILRLPPGDLLTST
eukprot:617086-Rhodomonas_salina.1